MKCMGYTWLMLVVFIVLIEVHCNYAAPGPQPDDMLKTLLKLDRMYSAIARPSVRSGPPTQTGMVPKVQRAINLLRLQQLDQLYAHRARPRFGKRLDASADLDYEGQFQASEDSRDWLPVRR